MSFAYLLNGKCQDILWNTNVKVGMTAKISDPRAVRFHNIFRYISLTLLVIYFVFYVEFTSKAGVDIKLNAWLQTQPNFQSSRELCDNPDFDFYYGPGEFLLLPSIIPPNALHGSLDICYLITRTPSMPKTHPRSDTFHNFVNRASSNLKSLKMSRVGLSK